MQPTDAQHDKLRPRVPEGPQGQHDVLPSSPLSIGRIDNVGALDALKSSDPLMVRAALAKIDPEALLDQIDKPKRPKWQTIIDDWVSVKVPKPVFDKWNA